MCLERTTEGWVGVDGTDGGGVTYNGGLDPLVANDFNFI